MDDLIIKKINEQIIKEENAAINIFKLYDLLDVELKNIQAINKDYKNNKYVIGTSLGRNIYVSHDGETLFIEYGKVKIEKQDSVKSVNNKLNTIAQIFKTLDVKYKLAVNDDFIESLKEKEAGSVIKYGKSYYRIFENTKEQIILYPIYKGDIKDFSFDKMEKAAINIEYGDKDSRASGYYKLVKDEVLNANLEYTFVPKDYIRAQMHIYGHDLEKGQVKNIYIGKEVLTVANNDGYIEFYKNGELTDQTFAEKVLGYAEGSTIDYTMGSINPKEMDLKTKETLLSLIANKRFLQAADFITEKAKKETITFSLRFYEKDSKQNFIEKNITISDGFIFKTSDEGTNQIERSDLAEIFKEKYQFLEDYYKNAFIARCGKITPEKEKLQEVFVKEAIKRSDMGIKKAILSDREKINIAVQKSIKKYKKGIEPGD